MHFEFCIALQAAIDIGGDIPQVILQGGILILQRQLYLADVIKHGGVVLAEFLADVRQTQVGQLADQIHGNLPGLCDALGFLGAAKHRFFHGVELAHLTDNEAGGGQGVALRT